MTSFSYKTIQNNLNKLNEALEGPAACAEECCVGKYLTIKAKISNEVRKLNEAKVANNGVHDMNALLNFYHYFEDNNFWQQVSDVSKECPLNTKSKSEQHWSSLRLVINAISQLKRAS